MGASTASILFPWPNSSATASTIVVRGTATDPDGVARVLVNDLVVPITAVAATSTSTPAGISNSLTAATATSDDVQSADSASEVQWSITLPLQQGENQISVTVEDASGEIIKELGLATVRYVEVPFSFDIDEPRLRVAGLSFSLDPDGYISRLVQHNYETGEQIVYPQRFFAPAGTCLKGDEEAFLYLDTAQGSYQLRRFDLVGRNDTEVVTIPSSLLDPGQGYFPSPFIEHLECSSGHDYAYVLANFSNENLTEFTRSRVLRIHLGSRAIDVLSETDPNEMPLWIARDLALTVDSLITLHGLNDDQPLTRIALDDGSRSVLAPGLNVGGLAIAPALGDGVVYVATFEGIDKVDIATAEKHNISEVQSDNPFVFAGVRSIAYDSAEHRVIVGDGDLDMLIAVDAETGERSDVLSRSIGSGPRMIAPRSMALSRDGTRAFVVDDGGNTRREQLLEIDLNSGNRQRVGNIDQQFESAGSGVAVDEEARLAYVSFTETILRVNVDSGDINVIAGAAIPGNRFSGISGLVLDAVNERLLVADSVLEAIVSVDTVSGEQTILSRSSVAGEGPAFDDINSIALVDVSDSLYVINQAANNVMRVDIATGNREVVLSECLDDTGINLLGDDETLQQVLFNDQRNELLILGNHLLSYDLESTTCSVAFRWIATRGVLHVQAVPGNRLLGTVFGGLVQLDGESREAVLVSK